jgi:putative transcriptional regulator
MKRSTKSNNSKRATDDIMHSLHELADAIKRREPLEERFTVHTVSIPAPSEYSPKAIRALRDQLGMSQAVFAELLGVSRIWVQSWERGVRQPSPLARRLMDTIRANPAQWLESIRKAG